MGSGFILSFHKYGAVSPLSVIGSARHTVFLPVGAGGVMQLAEEPQLLKKKGGGEKQHIIYTARENRRQGRPLCCSWDLRLAVDLG